MQRRNSEKKNRILCFQNQQYLSFNHYFWWSVLLQMAEIPKQKAKWSIQWHKQLSVNYVFTDKLNQFVLFVTLGKS